MQGEEPSRSTEAGDPVCDLTRGSTHASASDSARSSERRWTFAKFLAAHAPAAVISLIAALAVCSMMAAFGCSASEIAIVAIVLAIALAIAVAVQFARTRRYYSQLAEMSELLDEPWLLASMVEQPEQLEARVSYDAIDTICGVSARRVAAADRNMEEYRQYVEAWMHEVKVPLAAAQLVAHRIGGVDAAEVNVELEKVGAQLENALYYARMLTLDNDFSVRRVSLLECVKAAVKKNARFLIEHGATPKIDVREDDVVLADPKWLGFVLGQLVVNSAKYGARNIVFSVAGRGATPAQSGPAQAQSRRRTVLVMADDGDGIAPQDVPRVFERGFTGANGRRQGSSTGMGLYMCARICKETNLSIDLYSEEGRGTRVEIGFPIERDLLESSNVLANSNLSNS